ncbi:MAG: threonine ammonia-lyase [Alicyclobacillus sp.]|nr:threonine ammonia-lyase [Alicyclobacillus sp.]
MPQLADVEQARAAIRGVVRETPLVPAHTFSQLAGVPLFLKLENLQKTGSFKLRGAYNKLRLLPEHERARGVIAASAGNHAQGVAYAASQLGLHSTIVMPENASLAKIAATQGYGAEVVLHGTSFDAASSYAWTLQQSRGSTRVHAFDDPLVIAGQGTIGLEILDQLPSVRTIVVPAGGGGLVCGIALAVKSKRPDVRVFAVQAAAAPGLVRSLATGELTPVPLQPTLADGIAVSQPGRLTLALAQQWLDGVVTVEEEELARTLVWLLERSKLVAEGAGAAALAACIYHKLPPSSGDWVAVISGGNIDVTVLSRVIEHGLAESGRYLRLELRLADKPGALRDLLQVVAEQAANVLSIQHHRVGTGIALGQTEVELDLETRDEQHVARLLAALQARGLHPVRR